MSIYILFHIPFHCGLSQNIGYNSLCYTVGPCCLSSFLYVCVCVCIHTFLILGITWVAIIITGLFSQCDPS